MKNLRASFFCLLTYLFVTQAAFSASGSLFEVSSSGTAVNLKIQACLNVHGPNSCEVFDVKGLVLSIKSSIPGRTYLNAGIKVLSADFAIDSCANVINGYCVFSMNNQTPKQVLLNNLRNTQRFIFVANPPGNSIIRCIGNFPSGSVESCTDTGISLARRSSTLAANPLANFLYIGSNTNDGGVLSCSVAEDGGLSCGSYTSTPPVVTGIAIHPDATKIYLSSLSLNEVFYCDLNGSSITGCQSTGLGFVRPHGIVINSVGTHAYVVNSSDNSISTCEIAGDKSLIGCAKKNPLGLDRPSAIGIEPSGRYLYVSSINNELIRKFLILPDGSIGDGSDAALSIRSFGMTFGTGFAFFTIFSNNSLSVCSILGDNNLLCGDSGQTGFNGPIGIAII